MPDLLYFNPDPQIPDADMLGYGDLIYSNGVTNYLSGDPEVSAGLPRPPPGVSPKGSIGMGPQQQQQPEPLQGADGRMFTTDLNDPDNPIKPLGFNSVPAVDPSARPDVQPVPGSEQYSGDSFRPGGSLPGIGAAQPNAIPGMGGGASPGMQQPQPFPGADGRMYTTDINDPQNPIKPVDAGGFQPYQREGALPPDMAARQQGELGAMQQQTLAAEEQARSDQARIMDDATLKAMAKNEADRAAEEQKVAEQQAKVERWDKERSDWANRETDRSLSGALGLGGGIMAVLGSALLGSTGSDAGLRMIDSSIERHVREQVRQRDTQLGLLAEKIGSTQQAIRMGKAELYKLAADKAELLTQKTKNDVYEAQSPAIIQSLRQKQLTEMQEAEKLSMGKLTERMPAPPKPPDPKMLEKYGKIRRERAGNESITGRMEQTLGLMWSPGKDGQPGHYANKAEVLKKGIQGTGNLEQLLPDIVYSTGGGITAEGRQVRGAAEAMAFAQLRSVQPTGPISNSDIERAVKMGALDTEDGLLLGLERMRHSNEQQRQQDAAQYGPDLVAEYDRRFRAQGGQEQTATPAASRPATVEEMRSGAARIRTPQQQGPTSANDTQSGQERLAMLSDDLQVLAGDQLPPEGLAILNAQAAHETADGAHMPANNFFGMKASGRNRAGGAGSANLETTEGQGAGARRTRQDFATFDSSTAAAADMLSLLQRKYPRAWEALQAGDEAAYVAALKDGGYFTGNEGAYLQGIQRRL
jgi:flagellum-specific peptidoglycan hydrolase FlgJ